MEFVDEPAGRVESQLTERGITVRREPYEPRNRSLLSDFVGFLRSPKPGSTVTLFEDDEGKVRYYTVERRPDPEVEALKTRVEELTAATGAVEPERLERIERRLAAVDALEERVKALPELERKVAALPELERKVAALPELEAKVAALPELERKVAALPELERRVAALPDLEAKVERLSGLDRKVTQLDALRTRVEKLERPR
jgi:hypothetical protein